MITHNRADKRSVQGFIDSIDYLRAKCEKPRMEAQQFTFLMVLYKAGDEGMTMSAVAKALNVDNSFVSRNNTAFGARMMRDPLVFQRIDPMSPKCRLLSLSEAGHRMVMEALAISDGKMKFDRRSGVARM